MSRKIYSLVLVALVLALIAGPVAALPMGARTSPPQVSPGVSGLLDWFSSLVSKAWQKAGSIMDPNGTPASNKEGSIMDPNGTPAPAPGEAGSQMDPNGLNATGCPTEAGSDMDPDGKPRVCQPGVG